MGALTLKSFPFELRGWEIEKFKSIDPTDGFGLSTRVYISKQQIIQIEPNHGKNHTKTWLSDKGRQFFDGIFGIWNSEKNLALKKNSWQKTIATLLKTVYLFEHCSIKKKKNYFFTIVFESLGLETLGLLKIMEQNYSFLKLRRAEPLNVFNDLEFNFQLNAATNFNQLKRSTLCLLILTNPRYEGYNLNLDLRQRFLKGNFKCLILGSFINLTFPATFIGSNLQVLKILAEGNSFICQDFKAAKNPILFCNNKLSKRVDGDNIVKIVKNFKYVNMFNYNWNGLNTLNLTLSEAGIQTIAKFLPLKKKDLYAFSSFYFININTEQVPNLKKITESTLLNCNWFNNLKKPNINKILLDQNNLSKNNQIFCQNFVKQSSKTQYSFLPTKMFYETEETFINTEGLIKRTNRLITKKKTRDGWKLLRNLTKHFKQTFISLNSKNNQTLLFNANKKYNFLNFVNFHYCAVKRLETFKPFLTIQNQPFFISEVNIKFKKKSTKIRTNKLKYWIDDFFIGGQDGYSKNSLILANCSKILRTQSTNFF